MTIGQRMRDRRIELKLQPKDIADKIGKSLSTYYRYETDEIEKLTVSKMCEIAELLQVSPIYLLLGLEPETDYYISKKTDINNYSILSFSERLKDLIKGNRLTHKELASELNSEYKIKVTEKDIKDWENGIQSPDVASFVAISDYFKVSVDFLIGWNSPSLAEKDYTPKVKEPIREYNKESFMVKNLRKLLNGKNISLESISEKTGIDINALKEYAKNPSDDIDQKHIKLISDALGIPYVDMLYERNAGPLIEKIAALNSVQLDQVEEFIDKLLRQ